MPKDKDNMKKSKEPVLLVKPVVNKFGLDYLHMTLIVLVVILVALAFVLSGFKAQPVLSNCSYGLNSNSTCITPHHNSSQALAAAESVLASYSASNSSLSVLPYYTEANKATVSYVANQSEWLVVMPYIDPLANNATLHLSIILRDSNLSLVAPFYEFAHPTQISNNQVAALGAISLYGHSACTQTSMPVYAFIDPYAPGAIQAMYSGINTSKRYGSAINLTYKFIFTGYAISQYSGFGVNATQENAAYLFCASKQPRFQAFLANYSIVYTGQPIDTVSLEGVATGSGMNMTQFDSCLASSPSALNAQAVFSQYYGIQSTPVFIVNCKYQTIPETLGSAINYAMNESH